MLKRFFTQLVRTRPTHTPRAGGGLPPIAELQQAIEARQAGDIAAAETILRAVIVREPGVVSAHALLANVLTASGRNAEARQSYEHALELDPQQSELRFNYATLLKALRDFPRAEREFRQVIKEQPDWALPYLNYGLLALDQAQWKHALALLRRAVSLAPDMVEAHVNLAWALAQVGRLSEALEHCEAALAIDPRNVPALKNLACAHYELGDGESARAALRSRIATTPSDGAAIAMALALPSIVESREEIQRVRSKLASDLDRLTHAQLAVRDPAAEVGITPFYLAYHGENDRSLHEQVAALHLNACPELAYVAPHCGEFPSRDGGKIRIGFLSRFLYNHSVGRVTQGLIEQLDRQRFAVHALSFRPAFDAISHAIAGNVDEWVTLPRNLASARAAVARCELDVLLYPDVGMDAFAYFLTFARLARVQCATWGHPVTTGVPAIDYFLSTDYFEPDDAAGHYSERLVRLHDVAIPGYYQRPDVPARAPREALGFDRGRRVYFCPQALFKFHPDFDVVLARILRCDRGGEIVIVHDEQRDTFRLPRLRARLQKSAHDVCDRIVFLPRTPGRKGYLQRLQACDIVLDTMHYCGGNTSLEAISMGALVVTLPSKLNRGRQTYAFFRKMGFMDTVAHTPDEYVDLAVRIATDTELRTHLKRVQEEHAHALYEDRGAVDQISDFFEQARIASLD